jgi:6-pyruvoyltetrahydropterin/6-carboxytetrahydropterin synthase
MVIDFTDKENCKEDCDQFDHATVLMKLLSCRISTRIKDRGHHVILVDYQPTSENMVIDFAQRIIAIACRYKAFALKLQETESSLLGASDNL